MRIVIHAGMHKTGTTSVQKWLRDNAAVLSEHGVMCIVTPPEFVPKTVDALNRPAIRHQIDKARRNGAKRLIVSHESFSLTPPEVLLGLRDCFAEHAVEVVILIRHWRGYLPSRWKQNCLRRDSQPFNRFLNRLSADPERPDFRFDLALDALELMEPEMTKVLSYEVAGAAGTVFQATLQALGVPDQLIATAEPVRLNRSLPTKVADRLRILNGVLAEARGLEPDALFLSQSTGQPVGQFFDLFDMQRRMMDDTPETMAQLDEQITETTITSEFDGSAIATCETRLADRMGSDFWAPAGQVEGREDFGGSLQHSALEATDLDPVLRRRIAERLSRVTNAPRRG